MPTFVSTWTVAGTPTAAWAVLTAVEDWPRWWPGFTRVVSVRPGDDDGLGQRTHLTLDVGYRLRFGTEIVEIRRAERARARVVGDLCGTGIWTAREVAGGTRMSIVWDVQVRRAWMRCLAPLAGPVFACAHEGDGSRGAWPSA